jgi:hypothetical protein
VPRGQRDGSLPPNSRLSRPLFINDCKNKYIKHDVLVTFDCIRLVPNLKKKIDLTLKKRHTQQIYLINYLLSPLKKRNQAKTFETVRYFGYLSCVIG